MSVYIWNEIIIVDAFWGVGSIIERQKLHIFLFYTSILLYPNISIIHFYSDMSESIKRPRQLILLYRRPGCDW